MNILSYAAVKHKKIVNKMLFTSCCCFAAQLDTWKGGTSSCIMESCKQAEYTAMGDTLVESLIAPQPGNTTNNVPRPSYHPVFVHLPVELDGRKVW